MQRSLSRARIFLGETLNVILLVHLIDYTTRHINMILSEIVGEEVLWPLIGLMSEYPSNARNGYLTFVASVVSITFLASGVFGAWAGASPGKALVGIQFKGPDGRKASPAQMRKRAGLLVLLLLPILLGGPTLGFVFGPSADTASLIVLALSVLAFTILVIDWTGKGSWVNRTAGVTPHLRSR